MLYKGMTDTAMREVTHVCLDTLRVVVLFVRGEALPEHLLKHFYGLSISVALHTLLEAFTPQLAVALNRAPEAAPIARVHFVEGIESEARICNRCQSNERLELAINLLRTIDHVDHHLSGTMAATDEAQAALARLLEHKVNVLFDVVRQVKQVEVPVLVPILVVFFVSATVLVTTRVAEPHVVASPGEGECKRVLLVHDPAIGRLKQSVLQEDYLGVRSAIRSSDTEDRLVVGVTVAHAMALVKVTLLKNEVHE